MRSAFNTAAASLLATLSLAACAVTPPAGPTLMAAPGKGKTFEQFSYDDGRCRQYATGANNGVTPQQAATSSGVGSAAAGTLLGAAVGALFGAATGSPGVGAAFGAGGGLLIGSAVGSDKAGESASAMQGNYNRVYAQCMIASGQDVSLPPVAVAAYPQPVVVVAPTPYPYGYSPYGYAPYGYSSGWSWGGGYGRGW